MSYCDIDLGFLTALNPAYEYRVHRLNREIQAIGMGRYQWKLFVVAGLGWTSVNLWQTTTSLSLAPLAVEFNIATPPYLSLFQNVGYLIGAIFWGFGSDIMGRKKAFNISLAVIFIFVILSGLAPTFWAACFLNAIAATGVGGNFPLDTTLLLEFLPGSHQYLMTVCAGFWGVAQLLGTLMGWPLLTCLSCETDSGDCSWRDNMGWRILMFATGGTIAGMVFLRALTFKLLESPKFLAAKGRDEQAVEVIHLLAKKNKTTTNLTIEDLLLPEQIEYDIEEPTYWESIKFQLTGLFVTRRSGYMIILMSFIWLCSGIGTALYYQLLPYISTLRAEEFGDSSPFETYRNQVIIAVSGIPSCFLGGWLVERPWLGRRGSLAFSYVAMSITLFGVATARTSNILLIWNCAFTFVDNLLWGILYAYTPEIFPAKVRGTVNAVTSAATRIGNIIGPLVAIAGNLETSVPIYAAAGIFIAAGVATLCIPFESQGTVSV